MLYKAAYLYPSGAIECGDCIYATSDGDAVLMFEARTKYRKASKFGLHEVTGTADNGIDLIRVVNALPL